MSISHVLIVIISIVLLFAFSAPEKKVLIIGDSISLGYFPYVKIALESETQVFHNPGNAQHTGTGLRLLDRWIGSERYDLILFNWGLWDLCYRHPESTVQGKRDKINGQITYTVDQYNANMEQLVKRLKQTGATLVFVTTTVVPRQEAGRFAGDEIAYNEGAMAIMEQYDVEVLDLHRESIAIHHAHKLGAGDVHYTDKGYCKLAIPVIEMIRKKIQ